MSGLPQSGGSGRVIFGVVFGVVFGTTRIANISFGGSADGQREVLSGVENRLCELPHAESDSSRRTHDIYRSPDPRDQARRSLSELDPDLLIVQGRG